jgi:voltage-gated potassium channel
MFIVITTVILLVVETNSKMPLWIRVYEWFAVVFFSLEWIGRVWVSRDRLKFISSPLSIIDLLAIYPVFRPLRLLKIFRYISDINYLFKVFKEKSFEFLLLLSLFGFLVFFSATSLYIFESNGLNENIKSYYDAIYWSLITITTVGYGDISPVSDEGRFITILLIITGIMLISLLTSILTTTMTDKLNFIKENSMLHKIARLDSYILVCGYSNMAMTILKQLSSLKEDIVVLDFSRHKVDQALEDGFLAIQADATKSDIFYDLDIDHKASNILVFSGSDALNLSIILTICSINQNIKLYSRVINGSAAKKLKVAGVDEIINPVRLTAQNIYDYLIDKKYETIILGESKLSYELECLFINKQKDIKFIKEIDYHNDEEFKRYGIDKVDKNILCLSSDFEKNLFMTMSVKMLNANSKVITAVYNKTQGKKISLAGGDSVVNPYIIGAKYIEEFFSE